MAHDFDVPDASDAALPVGTASAASRGDRDLTRAQEGLRSSLERMARRRRGLPAPQVLLRAPGVEVGFGELSQPFHAASVGKLMTATMIAQLVEEGRLDLATPIGALLPASDVAGLPAASGVDVGADVQVEHLLAQTSGLPDFFEPPRGGRTDASVDGVVEHRDRTWRPATLLDEARRLRPVGRPGEVFHYADTNWVLLGRIAEHATGEAFAELLRTRVFEPSGMEHASTPYDATLMPDDLGEIDVAPFWIGGREYTRARCVSLDWAGGNVVATPEDFVRFQRALHGGRLVPPALLARMARPRNRFRRGVHYGLGTMSLRFREFFPLLRGLPQPVGHLGFWSTHLFYYPEQDAHVVLNFHADREMNRSFMTHVRLARMIARLG